MTNKEFERVYYPKYGDVIRAIARKFARDDLDLFDDLVSAGTIGLLHADPSKAGKNRDAYLRNIVRNKIVDHLRWLNRRDFERLDNYLAHNHDVVMDPTTGEPMLVHGENELVATPGYLPDGRQQYNSKAQRLSAVLDYAPTADDER